MAQKDTRQVKKCKSATFQLDGFCYTIVANPPNDDVIEPGAVSEEIKDDKDSEQARSLPGSIRVRKTGGKGPQPQADGQEDGHDEEEDEEELPPVDTLEACEKAAFRLRELSNCLRNGEVPVDVLQSTVSYAVAALEAIYTDPVSHLWDVDDYDELSEVQPDAVPSEVREWLASTFTRQTSLQRRKSEEKPRFRSVAHAIRAGILVDRIYRRCFSSSNLQMPAQIAKLLKDVESWSFDVFALNSAASGQCLRYMGHYLLNKYGLIQKFKIPTAVLENFLVQMEVGYERYRNPYHNSIHAADVTQTVTYFLSQGGLANWLSDLEIFATLVSAIIHDYEHTGTTNTFHVMSRSETAMLYNDRAVLENYHISQAFRLMREDETNILVNLSKEEYRDFRSLVIDMVIATDMSSHFQQVKTMKSLLCHPDFSVIDKPKALSLMLHCCDISHPSKDWELHFRWTQSLMEEFFLQGDKEKQLNLPYSPLCDRNTTLVAESQIGFIDFIVYPIMEVCGDLLDRIAQHVQDQGDMDPADHNIPSGSRLSNSSPDEPLLDMLTADGSPDLDNSPRDNSTFCRVQRPWESRLEANKLKWQALTPKDAELRALINEGSDLTKSASP